MAERRIFALLGTSLLVASGVIAAPALSADSSQGEAIYGSFCASCHGPYGRGDGPLAKNLSTGLPDFTHSTAFVNRSDEEIAAQLMGASGERHSPMSIAQVLSKEALVDAIAYVRTLTVPGGGVSVVAGRDVYNAACWACHGKAGDGTGPAVRGSETKARDFTSDEFVIDGREEELAQTVSLGAEKAFHGSPYMPEWAHRLEPEQIRDVVEFLKTFKHSKP
jgi:mono/diheme cytochrome c family protein